MMMMNEYDGDDLELLHTPTF